MKKKYFWSMLTIMMVALICSSLVSCSSDDDSSSGLSGWWFGNPSGYETANAIYFKNSTTVEFYFLVNNRDSDYPNSFSKKPGWYYKQARTYIYARTGDVIIFENGLRYTFSNGVLIDENGHSFTKL